MTTAKRAVTVTPEKWVYLCIKNATKAHDQIMKNPPETKGSSIDQLNRNLDAFQGVESPILYLSGETLERHADECAKIAYLATMPLVTTRSNTRAYIACVAAGVQRKYIAGVEARALLYTCQLALAAGRKTRA